MPDRFRVLVDHRGDDLLYLIPPPDRRRPPSWWRRHVVSDTHREPDRESDPVAFLRALAVLVLLSLPLWLVLVVLLRRVLP